MIASTPSAISTAINPGTCQKLVCATTSWAMLTPWSVIMRPTAPDERERMARAGTSSAPLGCTLLFA